ncbi:MAG: LysM peptidoglycan-binding domain-containing protein [Chloroflexota bacterium]
MKRFWRFSTAVLLLSLTACFSINENGPLSTLAPTNAASNESPSGNNPDILVPLTPPPAYDGTPTPDPPHLVPNENATEIIHTISAGETIGFIANIYGRSVEEILEINNLSDSDLVFVGQQLTIPASPAMPGPRFKIIPDSGLVYGPSAENFDVRQFANGYDGFLLRYEEEVEGVILAGPEIVSLIAHRFSVNPRLLLTILEYHGKWVTQATVVSPQFPIDASNPNLSGLYLQLNWAANQLNLGFYGRSEGNLHTFILNDGTRISYNPQINHGTAGVQRLLGQTNQSFGDWLEATGPNGFYATHAALFGNPFAYTFDPILPANLEQPKLRLPWASSETWFFTGGPHGGWAPGSAWAALDFATPGDQLGCVTTDFWVTAVSDGIVTRSEFGAVVVDMDGDEYAGTGWAITYMHIETRDRIALGERVKAGDRIGHPSCEGGFSNGTHLHIARTFNGRWVSADGQIPFNMNGWVSQGNGNEYDGFLVRNDVIKEACECRDEEINAIPGR